MNGPTPLRTAAPLSLPKSLHHLSQEEALEDARHLVTFLREVFYLGEDSPSTTLGQESMAGLQLVMGLLTDKLDIASGHYLFPLSGYGDSAQLAERKDG